MAENESQANMEESSFGLKQLVRTELLYTVTGLVLVVVGYGYLFLDEHLEWGAEYLLGRSVGAEVNIDDVETGWVHPGVSIRRLRITDPSDPKRNVVDLGTLSIRMSLNALLRSKLVITDASLEGLRTGTRRPEPGWVNEEGGDLRWLYTKLTHLVTSQLESATGGTVLGDLSGLLSGGSIETVLEGEAEALAARKRLRTVERSIEATEADLRKLRDRLPKVEDLNRVERKLESLKEVSGSVASRVRTIRELRRTVTSWESELETVRRDLTGSLEELEASLAGVGTALERDVDTLNQRMKLPEVNLTNPSNQIFQAFVAERGGRIADLLGYYETYVGSGPEGDSAAAGEQPGPPAGYTGTSPGRDYAYQTYWSYPDVWLKGFRLSGSGNQTDSLEFFARVNNLSTYPPAVSGQSGFTVNVTRPTDRLDALKINLSRARQGGARILRYQLTMEGLSVKPWDLISTDAVRLKLHDGRAMIDFSGTLRNGTLTSLVTARMANPNFEVSGPNDRLNEALRTSLAKLDHLELQATGKGSPDAMDWRIRSNLGTVLKEALRSFVRDQAGAIKDEMIGDYRRKIEAERNRLQQQLTTYRSKYLDPLIARSKRLERLEETVRKRLEEAARREGAEGLGKLLD